MKKLLLLPFFTAVLLVGCSGPVEPVEPVEQVRNIDISQLQERSGIVYTVNEEAPYTGTVRGSYENGKKKSEAEYVDGKKHGKSLQWYENGQKKSEDIYVDGKEHGKSISWYENGQKSSEVDFADGKAHGKAMGWEENGQKWLERDFVDGKLQRKRHPRSTIAGEE